MNFFKSLYLSYAHNVDAHVKTFQKAAARLSAAEDFHHAQAAQHDKAAKAAEARAETSNIEAGRAGRIATKLNELVS